MSQPRGTFTSTSTVNAVKMSQGFNAQDKALEIIKNPNTNKLFFRIGTLTGAISDKKTPQEYAAAYATKPQLVCVSILRHSARHSSFPVVARVCIFLVLPITAVTSLQSRCSEVREKSMRLVLVAAATAVVSVYGAKVLSDFGLSIELFD